MKSIQALTLAQSKPGVRARPASWRDPLDNAPWIVYRELSKHFAKWDHGFYLVYLSAGEVLEEWEVDVDGGDVWIRAFEEGMR